MKSKTSCFNRTIFKKNFTHFWPLWLLYQIYLLVVIPVWVWQKAASPYYYYGTGNEDTTYRMYQLVELAVHRMIPPLPVFFFAVAAALAVFSYLYSAKSTNMMHALPVNRLELYVTNYLSGLIFLIVPEIITFFITVLVCLANQFTCIQYLFAALLAQAGVTFFAYSLAVFVAMFTGQAFAMPCYYVIVNYLYVGCMFIVAKVIETISYGIENAWNPGKSCILSPLYYLNNNLRSSLIYTENGNGITGIKITGMPLTGIYAAAAVVLVVAAYQLYKRRQIETAGDWVSIGIIKPVFRWGAALCGGLVVGVTVISMLTDLPQLRKYPCLLLCSVAMGFLFFFGAEMLLEKNFRVFRRKRVLEWAATAVITVVFVSLFEMDAFGLERYVPEVADVETAFVYLDYPVQVKGEELATLTELQRQIIANKDAYQEVERTGSGFYYTTFLYYMQDGSKVERRYALPLPEADGGADSTPAEQILAWESEPENLEREIFGIGNSECRFTSGYMDLYTATGLNNTHMFSEKEIEQILKAIRADIEDGNLAKYYQYCEQPEDTYYSNIELEYYSTGRYVDNWMYYYDYHNSLEQLEGKAVDGQEMTAGGNLYLTFGPDCVHIVETLEKLGITNDEWKLMTNQEMMQ